MLNRNKPYIFLQCSHTIRKFVKPHNGNRHLTILHIIFSIFIVLLLFKKNQFFCFLLYCLASLVSFVVEMMFESITSGLHDLHNISYGFGDRTDTKNGGLLLKFHKLSFQINL